VSAPDWKTRVRVRHDGASHARGGGPAFAIGEPLGLGADRSAPAAVELALGALGGELTQLLAGLCAREGLTLDSLELSLTATLAHPLAALGVVGVAGVPAIAAVDGSCHVVSLDPDGPERLPALWAAARARAVLLNTLGRACPVTLRFNAI